MADEGTITWTGGSGKEYKYWLYSIGASFKDEPGNYIFVKKTKENKWHALYIGETGSLATRLNDPDSHHKIECVRKEGGTHICAHLSSADEDVRRAEEADLLANRSPECQG